MAARLKKRQSLSVPTRGQLGLRRQHSLSSEPLLGSEECKEPGARRSRDTRRSGDQEQGARRKQKTRTISVPVGLKEILNELSKEVYIFIPYSTNIHTYFLFLSGYFCTTQEHSPVLRPAPGGEARGESKAGGGGEEGGGEHQAAGGDPQEAD